MSLFKPKNLYERAGISDVAEFYSAQHATGQLLDACYFSPLNRFDIRWTRTMWIYDNVRRGSSALDLGCGAGMLALLKRKGVTLTGVDLSAKCARTARRNGYDATYVARLTALPFADATFDYVVSLDVMGHIEFEEKDTVLGEIRRVLRPDGVTMHGIECLDRERHKDYDEMSDEELRRYIGVDGHVGMEDETEIATRFRRFFPYVRTEPRYAICQSHDEFIKQADAYGSPLCDPDLLDYLRGLSFEERRAFNIAMGYVFDKISEYGIRPPKSEYVLLKASFAPPGSFYNEHRDRSDLNATRLEVPAVNTDGAPQAICLDRSTGAIFDGGWYEAEIFPPVARWMRGRARISFAAPSLSKVRLDLMTHLPDIKARPVSLEFFLNGTLALSVSLFRYGWLELEFDASEIAARDALQGASGGGRFFVLEIRANRTWQPCLHNPQSSDDRQLSIAVCNIEIFL